VVDGVFVPDDAGRVRFHETGAPSREALERIVRRMRDRTLRWLRKKGLLEERPAEDQSNEAPETNARGACAGRRPALREVRRPLFFELAVRLFLSL
jgi:hypothetical protein